MPEHAPETDVHTLAAALEQTKERRRRQRSSTAVAPGLQRYQNATHWPSGNALPRSLAKAAQISRRYPHSIAEYGILLTYVGSVLCLFIYGWVKPMRDPCLGVPFAVRATVFGCIFCFPNALFWLVRYATDTGKTTDLDTHVRVLYLLLFLDRAEPGRAWGVLRAIKEKNLNCGDISLQGIVLPALPSVTDHL